MLAFYVEWHMREAWRELMFADTDQAAKATRDPVAPAQRSQAAQDKAARHTLDDGSPAHSFSTLLADLAGIVRNTCRAPNAAADAPTFQLVTTPTAKQHRAFELLKQIQMWAVPGTPISRQLRVVKGQTRSANGGTPD